MQPDTSIGPYRVVRSLGQGGMGEVALAYDSRLKRQVALKSVLSHSSEGRSRLVREARAIAALTHPAIAGIHDILEYGDRSYIVMEYVEGETLWQRLTRGAVGFHDAADYCAQLCEGLAAAHDRGIVHRDLKPTNIMVTAGGRIKILDFGLARREATAATPNDTTTTVDSLDSARLAGTVGYIAPEQVLGHAGNARSDLFSLGVVMFEMFTGRRPFPQPDMLDYALAVTSMDAPPASTVNASLAPSVSDVIAKALRRNPEERYESARALAIAMETANRGAATITVDVPARAGPRRRWSLASIAAFTLLMGAIVAMLTLPALPWRMPILQSDTAPTVLAVLPASATDVDPTLQAVAAGMTTMLTANLARVQGLNAVPAAAVPGKAGTAPTVSQAAVGAGANWALQTTLRLANGGISTQIELRKAGEDAPSWQQNFEGDALTVTRRSLLALSSGVVEAGLLARLDDASRQRLIAVGTDSPGAFLEYARGRRFMAGVTTVDALSQASTHFEAAVNGDARFALGWAGLAESLRRRYQQTLVPGDGTRALDAAQRAAGLDPNLAAVQLTLASVFSLSGRSADALAAVDRAIALQPSHDEAYRLRGPILIQLNRNDEGIDALQHAVILRPFYSNYESLGFYLYRVGRLRESADAYRRVTELAPDYAGGYQGLGTVLHRLGDVDEAIGHHEHAVRLGPSATAYSNLAYSYYETGRYREALAAFLEAIKRDARRPGFHRNIGDVYARLDRTAEARAAYRAAIDAANALLKVNANDATTIALVALCEAKLGQALRAERHAAEALSLAPKNQEVAVRNAEVYAILRQPSRALRHLASAMQLGYDRTSLAKNEELKPLAAEPEFKLLTDRDTDQIKQE